MRLATQSWGDEGRPLAVLIHGVTGSSRAWWRVGPWFAERGWHAVAPDLRGHGSSPGMRGDETLEDLARDIHETILEQGTADVLLGHSLGALTALELCRLYEAPARGLVLEDPPGSASTNSEEIAQAMEAGVDFARRSPEDVVRQILEENPTWPEQDARNTVAGMRECDVEPVAALIRTGMRFDLTELAGVATVPALLVLGSEERGSALPSPEREAVSGALLRGTTEEFDAGHGIHRDDFDGYVRLLGDWLGGPAV